LKIEGASTTTPDPTKKCTSREKVSEQASATTPDPTKKKCTERERKSERASKRINPRPSQVSLSEQQQKK
jgi:hypothetical protein